jgi:integral membrane sensor domain MASE1
MAEQTVIKKGVQPIHIVILALSSAIATVLGIISVQLVPVVTIPGVSGLFLAAGFYVPFGLWWGIWGALAGGISGFLLIAIGTPVPLAAFFFIGDFLEPFVPLVAFRVLKLDPGLRNTKSVVGYLIFGVIGGALASALVGPTGIIVTAGLSMDAWWPTFVPWLIGDIIVILVIGIILLRVLTPVIERMPGYVKRYLS